ncbi:CaiB/BaiF CoA transferase family protein [Mycolicibacterium arenosum]|uniref:CoA transferase n=1 Tax=Mycolicibacterium arenosum TaxID=2952157 RepID=A0ABT1M7I2_9MYCO|nr:CoA transferase [Mycolicibacterium sp. CAU 1645]MCP9275134.1 CoA transferase [Mycolicibacterium sp. CAU 1645]
MVDRCQVLASVRVLDLGDADTDIVGRLLADLGADVLKIEPPGGAPGRHTAPSVAGTSIGFTLGNANKRSAVLDPESPADRARLVDLAGAADVLIDRGGVAAFGTTAGELADRFPQLVVLAVSDFGATGPRAHWRATDAVLCAMSTALSRSGPTTGRPVLPPVGIASATAAVQATWATLVALYHRMRCGTGDYIDFSRFEAVVQALDPPFGSEGQAAVGLKQSHELWRGRPRNQQIYPTFACRDGFVRMCLLSGRQWRGMFGWLGEPARFSDPAFETIAARYAASAELNAAFAELFADGTMADLVAEGQRRGVPLAAVLTPAEALASAHFQSVGALTEVAFGDSRLPAPTGPFVLDGRHAGHVAECAEAEPTWIASAKRPQIRESLSATRPFEGLRILDLGVIVAGGELGRLFADLGADVVKIESAAYPDGLRQTLPGKPMSRSWALTHRNEASLGLDLRHPDGAELFRRLVAGADAVFANFKPGTLESLGFSHTELLRMNPRIVLAESSAFGATGPWSAQMGYGPLVRATTGVSRLWASDDPADTGFYDATTIFPDHVAARITAIAALAAMIGGDDTGAHVHISQAEVAVNTLATSFVAQAARAAGLDVDAGDELHGVYPCAGDDEWCVVSLRSTADRDALADVLGVDGLPSDRAAIAESIAAWSVGLDKVTVAERLQDRGVCAAPMNRAVDVLADPQLRHRNVFAEMVHPLFEKPMHAERRAAPSRHIPDADLRPAPMPGEQTRAVCRTHLDLTDDAVDDLIERGVLFAWQPDES